MVTHHINLQRWSTRLGGGSLPIGSPCFKLGGELEKSMGGGLGCPSLWGPHFAGLIKNYWVAATSPNVAHIGALNFFCSDITFASDMFGRIAPALVGKRVTCANNCSCLV